MSLEGNKKTLQRYFDELMNNRDYSRVNEILHEDYTGSGDGGVKGIAGHKQLTQCWHSAAPDIHYETLEMVAKGDKVVVFDEFKCTLVGEHHGIKGKGQSITRYQAAIYEFKGGKVIRGATRLVNDSLSFFQQLGALPPTEDIIKVYNDSLK